MIEHWYRISVPTRKIVNHRMNDTTYINTLISSVSSVDGDTYEKVFVTDFDFVAV